MVSSSQSLNGVFVNGEQIPSNVPQEIRPGDQIRFIVEIDKNIHELDYSFDVLPCTRKRKLESPDDYEKESKLRKVLRPRKLVCLFVSVCICVFYIHLFL